MITSGFKWKKIYGNALFIWFIFLVMTVSFGAFREAVFIPAVKLNGNLARAVLLPVTFIYLLGITYLFLKKTKSDFNQRDMLIIGSIWLVLTILFEFVFGYFVMGHSLNVLLEDYNLLKGRTWGLFLLCLFFAPIISYKFLHRNNN